MDIKKRVQRPNCQVKAPLDTAHWGLEMFISTLADDIQKNLKKIGRGKPSYNLNMINDLEKKKEKKNL
jgi:hypothetical protein